MKTRTKLGTFDSWDEAETAMRKARNRANHSGTQKAEFQIRKSGKRFLLVKREEAKP